MYLHLMKPHYSLKYSLRIKNTAAHGGVVDGCGVVVVVVASKGKQRSSWTMKATWSSRGTDNLCSIRTQLEMEYGRWMKVSREPPSECPPTRTTPPYWSSTILEYLIPEGKSGPGLHAPPSSRTSTSAKGKPASSSPPAATMDNWTVPRSFRTLPQLEQGHGLVNRRFVELGYAASHYTSSRDNYY